MAHTVTCHLRLLCLFKCLNTALKTSSKSQNYTDMTLSTCWVVELRDKLWKRSQGRLTEDNPFGRPTIVSACCTRTYYDPVSHISNSTVTTCTDSTRAFRRWGTRRKHLMLQCVSVLSDRRAGTLSSHLYQREIQPGEPVSLERSDLERKMGCQCTIPQVVMKNRPTRRLHVMLARFHL